jgi:hypothetical protein
MIRLLLILMLASAVPLAAQNASAEGGRDAADTGDVPADHRPPPGMCRIWIDGVPAARQPAPTDCSTAIRRRPPNAKVVFGKELRDNDRAPVRIPGIMPLVDDRRKPADSDRTPEAGRDGDVPPNLVPVRTRDTSSPAPNRPPAEVLRPKSDRPETRSQPQSRPEARQPERRPERRPEQPKTAQPRTTQPRDVQPRAEPSRPAPRRIDPPQVRSRQPAAAHQSGSIGGRRRPEV